MVLSVESMSQSSKPSRGTRRLMALDASIEDDSSDMTYFSGMSASSLSKESDISSNTDSSKNSSQENGTLMYSLVSIFGSIALIASVFLLYRKYFHPVKLVGLENQTDVIGSLSVAPDCDIVKNPLVKSEISL